MNQDCKNIDDFIEDTLGESARREFISHLESCVECQSEFAFAKELDENIRDAWLSVEVPTPVRSPANSIVSTRSRLPVQWAAAAVAITATIALLIAGVNRGTKTNEEDSAITQLSEKVETVDPNSESPVAFSMKSEGHKTIMVPVAASGAEFTIVKAFPAYEPVNE